MRTGELYQRYHGVYAATVVDVNDPEKLGRVRIDSDQFEDSQDHPVWASVARPMANSKATVYFTPKVGDQVILGYLVGDVNEPVILGYAHSQIESQRPPKEIKTKFGPEPVNPRPLVDPNRHGIITDSFHIEINEAEGERALRFTNRVNGDFIEMNAEENTITVNAMTALSLKAAGVIDIFAPQVQINGRVVAAARKPI